jgi:phosphatidate phosphatase APP1
MLGVQPFIDAIAPARFIEVSIPCAADQPHTHTLGPSNANGISSQIVLTGGGEAADGTVIKITSVDNLFPSLSAHTRFAGPDGWAIISDVDDTIKVTHTTDPIGTLKTTFAEIPKTTEGMPEFYQVLDAQFQSPAWFYLVSFSILIIHVSVLPGLFHNHDQFPAPTKSYKSTDRMRHVYCHK